MQLRMVRAIVAVVEDERSVPERAVGGLDHLGASSVERRPAPTTKMESGLFRPIMSALMLTTIESRGTVGLHR
jgi:hypothetical protein